MKKAEPISRAFSDVLKKYERKFARINRQVFGSPALDLNGKLSDERYARMSSRYEDEQAEISEKLKTLRKEIAKSNETEVTADMFIGIVRKYMSKKADA